MYSKQRSGAIERIISGGQTGVDRAALDAAMAAGIPCGGCCPQGRRAEDGEIPGRYPLSELASPRYADRTARNVRDADATLVIVREGPDCGTELTVRTARHLNKPLLVVDLDKANARDAALAWLRGRRPSVINIAGPRESERPGIYQAAFAFLCDLLETLERRGAR